MGKRTQKPRTRLTPGRHYPNKLRALRVKAGKRLQDLADLLKVSPQAIREAEVSGTGLSKRNWYHLADLFDIDPRELEEPFSAPE